MQADAAKKTRFNYRLSRTRMWVERTFNRLKTRFPSLRAMGEVSDINDLYRSIAALMVLHNICIDFGDSPFEDPNWEADDGAGQVDHGEQLFNDSRFAGHELDEDMEEGGREENETDTRLLAAGRTLRDNYLRSLE